MCTIKDVAKLFVKLGEGEDVTNLKVQKLAYYAQGFYLALFDKPLFNENIEAWAHGPVVPELYHEFKVYGKKPIPAAVKFNEYTRMTKAEIAHVEEIYEVFGQFSAWKLRNMTHEESPWLNNEETASIISKDELKQYFLTRIA